MGSCLYKIRVLLVSRCYLLQSVKMENSDIASVIYSLLPPSFPDFSAKFRGKEHNIYKVIYTTHTYFNRERTMLLQAKTYFASLYVGYIRPTSSMRQVKWVKYFNIMYICRERYFVRKWKCIYIKHSHV